MGLFKHRLDLFAGDQDLIQHLFMDAAIVDEMLPKWKENIPGTIEAAFVATNAGLTKVFPARSVWISSSFNMTLLSETSLLCTIQR